jgi:hypothetical protein
MADLTNERLSKLARFLAAHTGTAIDVSTPRPMPDVGEVLVLKALLNFVRTQIGKGDAAVIEQTFRGVFERHAGVSEQVSEIWDRYGSDGAFFAFLNTLITQRRTE